MLAFVSILRVILHKTKWFFAISTTNCAFLELQNCHLYKKNTVNHSKSQTVPKNYLSLAINQHLLGLSIASKFKILTTTVVQLKPFTNNAAAITNQTCYA